MKVSRLLQGLAVLASPLASSFVQAVPENAETHRYESDISKLRSIVIHSLYSQKDVFLRELLSNSADALQKLRITSLREGQGLEGWQGNITIEARKNGGGKGGQLIIRDTGIGMTKEELATNLGTIAKSGTGEFLKRATELGNEGSDLIGQFGLGFYSSYLVAPNVRVASLPAPSPSNPDPEQFVFESEASGESFAVYVDPRGKSLRGSGPCGTEIVLEIPGAGENDWVLDEKKLKGLVEKHSQFASSFPIYLLSHDAPEKSFNADDELEEEEEELEAGTWVRLNDKGPIWMREPKKTTEEEYRDFYKTLESSPSAETLGWLHWKGDTGSGVSFRALMYIPASVSDDFWQKASTGIRNLRLMVKRVFITDDLGDDYLPKWLSFLKIVVDADDLPLNVSRETLQTNKFIKQLKSIIIRKALDLFTKLSHDDADAFKKFSDQFGTALRLGILETSAKKDVNKLAGLLRMGSTRTEYTSLDEYVEKRRGNQKQIYFLASAGESIESLQRSAFVEKPVARGYEVLLLNQPPDEIVMQTLKAYRGMTFQDVSKKGLKYGDEDDHEAEKAELAAQNKAFAPLISWLKKAMKESVGDVVLTNRLVSSPCAIVADNHGWSANTQKLAMANAKKDDPMLAMMAHMPKILELNPKSPLITGLLERVLDLPENDPEGLTEEEQEAMVSEEEEDLKENAAILIDTALIRSGFQVKDSNIYFDRVESLLRRSLGVSLTAKTKTDVRPAPPVAEGPLPEIDAENADSSNNIFSGVGADALGDAEFVDWQKLKAGLKDGVDGLKDGLEGLKEGVEGLKDILPGGEEDEVEGTRHDHDEL